MCHSVTSNYYSWLESFISSIILLMLSVSENDKNDLWISLFILTFTQIQVIESIIWAYIESGNIKKAIEMTKYIVPLLWLQPVVNCAVGYVVTKNKILLKMSFMYMMLLIYDSYYAFTTDTFSIEIGKHGHLVWKRNGKIDILNNKFMGSIYLGWIIPFFFMENQLLRINIIAFSVISGLYFHLKYGEESNSMWCNISSSFCKYVLAVRTIQYIK